MARFPRDEALILALMNDMIAGYATNPGIFPGAQVAALEAARDAFLAASHGQLQKKAEALVATENKKLALARMTKLMGNQIKQSEVDTAEHPGQLELIGWGARKKPDPAVAPGQPRMVRAVEQGTDWLTLKWKAPAKGDGGAVQTYVVERRVAEKAGEEFGAWEQIATVLDRKITLEEQPRYVQMEYCVFALNAGGVSKPSNLVAVVL